MLHKLVSIQGLDALLGFVRTLRLFGDASLRLAPCFPLHVEVLFGCLPELSLVR